MSVSAEVAAKKTVQGLLDDLVRVHDEGMGIGEHSDGFRKLGQLRDQHFNLETAVDRSMLSVRPWPFAISGFPCAHLLGEARYINGIRGHPVGFTAEWRDDLLALNDDFGARNLLASVDLNLIPTGDPGVIRDIDRPGDLTAL